MKKTNNTEFYNALVKFTLEHFIENQIPFKGKFFKTTRLENYLPALAFNHNLLIIDFMNWTLETAFIVDDVFNCVVVYGETEFPLTLEYEEFLQIINIETGIPVIGKFFTDTKVENLPNVQKKLEQNTTELDSSSKYEELNKNEIQKSMSSMRLVKPGEA